MGIILGARTSHESLLTAVLFVNINTVTYMVICWAHHAHLNAGDCDSSESGGAKGLRGGYRPGMLTNNLSCREDQVSLKATAHCQ